MPIIRIPQRATQVQPKVGVHLWALCALGGLFILYGHLRGESPFGAPLTWATIGFAFGMALVMAIDTVAGILRPRRRLAPSKTGLCCRYGGKCPGCQNEGTA